MILCDGPNRSEILGRFNNSDRQTTLSVTIAAKCLLRRVKAGKKAKALAHAEYQRVNDKDDLLAR